MRALRVIASSISPSISHETFFSARRAVKTRFACSVAQRGRFIYLSDSAVERALAALADVGELLEIRRLSRKLRTRMRAPPQGRMCLPLCGRVGVVVDATAEDLSGSKATAKVSCTLAISSTLGRVHAWHWGIIHALRNFKKFETATEILDIAR